MRPAERDKYRIPTEAVVVGSIIRFSEEKRPALMIEMAFLLAARHPGTRFLFFGGGPLLEEMRALVKSRGLDQVILLPGLTQNAWHPLSAMDIFVPHLPH